MADLSVLIPARREQWLSRTVEDVLSHAHADTEVIVVLDGEWPEKGFELKQHPKVTVLKEPASIGQRAATNLAARVSTARYVMKLDGHCAVAPGFDVALIDAAQELGPACTQIPMQKNLHVYDQVCAKCGDRADQAPALSACRKCGSSDLQKAIVWRPRSGRTTTNWVLDSELHFQYASNKKQSGEFCEVMSSLGACFFMERARFWELGGLDEATGSWGQFGAEVALKSWLSGGRHVVNKRTWFAHFFRVGGIGFPYAIKSADQEYARTYSRNLWRGNHWEGQTLPLRWLVDKFWDDLERVKVKVGKDKIPAWTEAQRSVLQSALPGATLSEVDGSTANATTRGSQASPPPVKGLVYYTDNRGDDAILSTVREQLKKVCNGFPIVASQLKPWVWGPTRTVLVSGERGYLTMFRQILAGLQALETEHAFLVEHDVLYDASHFKFTPPRSDTYYYNLNVWHVNASTGQAVTYTAKRTSQLCANRLLLVEHYRKRIALVERDGFSRKQGFEPGSHSRKERIDDVPSDVWISSVPNIDIRHGHNLTPSRWRQDEFRDQRNCQDWQESAEVPGWGRTLGRFDDFLREVRDVQQAVA